jgi:hypothetical protein
MSLIDTKIGFCGLHSNEDMWVVECIPNVTRFWQLLDVPKYIFYGFKYFFL